MEDLKSNNPRLSPGAATAAAPTEEWWASLSAAELRNLVNRGFAAGSLFEAAVAEANRRQLEALQSAQVQAHAVSSSRKRKRVVLMLASIAAAVVCAVVLLLLLP